MYDSESAKQFMSDAENFAEQNRIDRERKIDAENAAIKSAQKNWFERNVLIWNLILIILGAVLGAIATKILT